MISIIASAIISTAYCSWDNPGANRYIGSVPEAIRNYSDIPKDIREKLYNRLKKHDFDDLANITKDYIAGKHEYQNLRDMHFGKNQVCTIVSRDKWKQESKELGLVYCEGEYCIIVPTVCGNISRVSKIEPSKSSTNLSYAKEDNELVLDPPSAGQDLILNPTKAIEPKSFNDGVKSFSDDFITKPLAMIGKANPIIPPVGIPILPLIPGIPEPSSYLLFFLGIPLLWLLKSLRK